MCTMSMDRYFTLKYPMRYGRNKTKTMVLVKIFFVWVVSMAISSPICIHGFVDPTIVYNDGLCMPVLTDLRHLRRLMQRINQTDLRPKLAQLTAQCTGLAPPEKSSSFRQHRERRHKPTHLDVPSQVFYRRGRVGTFIKILTCRMKVAHRMKFMDEHA
nr:hypothetical protein BaRGS_009507 [Batillaria attramentaria]